MIKDRDEYLNNVMKKILNSYSIIENLSDRPIDLELLEVEVRKINGFLLVLSKKITPLGNNSSDTKNLEKKIIFYMQNHDFSREINLLLDTYYGKILKMKSNGRSGGTTNLYFDNGTKSFKELLNTHTKALYICLLYTSPSPRD